MIFICHTCPNCYSEQKTRVGGPKSTQNTNPSHTHHQIPSNSTLPLLPVFCLLHPTHPSQNLSSHRTSCPPLWLWPSCEDNKANSTQRPPKKGKVEVLFWTKQVGCLDLPCYTRFPTLHLTVPFPLFLYPFFHNRILLVQLQRNKWTQ
jgi:hypothetical protein